MKNLNVKLAENFNVEFTNVGFDEMGEGTTEDDYDALLSHAELFIADLAKKNIFPEKDEVISIPVPSSIGGKVGITILSINLDLDESMRLIYTFNKNFELEKLHITDVIIG